jgi:UDP-N-acetyl-D-galactosamine dehydrogenase
MGAFVARQTVKRLLRDGKQVAHAKITVLGLAFKENCSDLRNSRVADVVRELRDFGCAVSVHDPVAAPGEALREYGISLTAWDELPEADALVAAVSHREYLAMPQTALLAKLRPGGLFVDVKSAYDPAAIKAAGYSLWRL